MTTGRRAAPTRLRRVLVVAGVVAVVGMLGVLYTAWAVYLAIFSSEGSLPPRWRVPDVPAGVQVVSESKDCASGGCWREIVLRPAADESPDDVATEMGILGGRRDGWQLFDPHAVTLDGRAVGGELVVFVQYVTSS